MENDGSKTLKPRGKYQLLSDKINSLKKIAMTHSVPVITASQSNQKQYQNVGNRPIESANDSNIPVGVTIIFSKINQCYRLVAENYKPILAKIEEKAYIVDAKDKKTLVEVVQKYITPLYRIALINLTKTGENWLWFPNSPNE